MQCFREFRQRYLEYSAGATDAHPIAHQAVFEAVVGLLLGRKVGLRFGHGVLYPNRWVVLVGPSSTSRKSTTVNIARSLIHLINPALMADDSIVVQRLWESFSERSTRGMFVPELSTWLADARMQFNDGLIQVVTDWFDCPELRTRRFKDVVVEVRNPFLAIVAGSTPEWLVENMGQSDLAGGFFARMECVVLPPRIRTYDTPPDPDPALLNGLVEDGLRIHRLFSDAPRVFHMSESARSEYARWRQTRGPRNSSTPQLAPMYERIQISALKSALANAVLDGAQEVGALHVATAIPLADSVLDGVGGLADQLCFTQYERSLRRVREAIHGGAGVTQGAGGVTRSRLLRDLRIRPKDLQECVSALILARQIEETPCDTVDILYRWIGKEHP